MKMKTWTRVVIGLAVALSGRAAEAEAAEKSRRNLKEIWGAYRSYALLHDGKNPARLGDLLAEDLVAGPQVFSNPAAGTPVPKRAEVDEKGDYTATPLAGAPGLIVREKTPTHTPGKVLVAFKDGTIEAVDVPPESAGAGTSSAGIVTGINQPGATPALPPTPVAEPVAEPAPPSASAGNLLPPSPPVAANPLPARPAATPAGAPGTFTLGQPGGPSLTITVGGLGGGRNPDATAPVAPPASAAAGSAWPTELPGAAAITEFQFLDAAQDRVSGHGNGSPDGRPDGRFHLGLALPAGSEVLGVKLIYADAAGTPGAHTWSSRPEGLWMIGVFRDGAQLNPTHAPTLGRMEGTVALELFLADVGVFKPGENFLVEVALGGGATLRSRLRSPTSPLAAPGPAAGRGATTPPPSANAAGIADFRFIDRRHDKVGAGGNGSPDGGPDAWFRLAMDFRAMVEVKGIMLRSADASGQPTGHHWSSRDGGSWILGVERDGTRLNQGYAPTLGRFANRVEFDLFAQDNGAFAEGLFVLAEVSLGAGPPLTRLLQIGPESGRPSLRPPLPTSDLPPLPPWPKRSN